MNPPVSKRSEVKITDTHFTMAVARRRYRREKHILAGLAFRPWARRTFNPIGCVGKLLMVLPASVEMP